MSFRMKQRRDFHSRGRRRRGDSRRQVERPPKPDAEAKEVLFIPAVHLGSLEGFETTVVAYTTDIPAFGGSLGTAVSHRPGQYPCGAYCGGADLQIRAHGSRLYRLSKNW